eukprot:TRINITY_DN4655_c0_g1_i1.p2 TRINITY_DN4655_c0_g1~~TRINITY_DN4655_c0_g1_i1.p2  ORF type:complete len:118 (-),score=0.43 TRINITY_DN4655_c0_g1_i1:1332-1685(-)
MRFCAIIVTIIITSFLFTSVDPHKERKGFLFALLTSLFEIFICVGREPGLTTPTITLEISETFLLIKIGSLYPVSVSTQVFQWKFNIMNLLMNFEFGTRRHDSTTNITFISWAPVTS